MIFKEVLFEAVNVEKLYKSQMNGFNDKSIPEFNLIMFSSLFKKEAKEDGLQKEFIQSYLECAKILSERLEELEKPQMGINKVFYSYSLTLPIIYLCRHCLELSIKYAISRIDGKPKNVHGLDKIWSSFLSYLPENYSGKERSLLKNMREFVQDINLLDDTGTKLRYPLEQDGTCTENKFKWANSKLIVDTTEKFVKQLGLLDIG
ncbi:HEPN domain-containing protein [Clostridium estertheticum]|uniref:HEPN domain-containing protein n=1 Tax=Clostridium estertheticum TaxID=238834 RepID=A0A7Y3WSX0_9CLOT|nr:HEPN domain-containing protein [Clostridium estertheticum]NNU76561.1 HEPN domain-containing protein [Clostridium estertheticum]WBL49713.1 HEPN domain-containing protein [Clostridium estertheticum]